MRSFQGRASEELYNEALLHLYHTLKHLSDTNEPEEAIEGALWIENNNLKVKRSDKFEFLYQDIYQSMADLVLGSRPENPKPGQLWITDGVLVYYNGIKWEPVKATTIEDFSLDGFEPFLIIDSLEAGTNEIIKKQPYIMEEEFISGENATDFILKRGQYEPSQNKVVVYVNGRMIPRSAFLEHNERTIRLNTPTHEDDKVTIQYIMRGVKQDFEYIPLKFHPALNEYTRVIQDESESTFTLPSSALCSKEYMAVYINGRYLSRFSYSLSDNQVTIKIDKTEVGFQVGQTVVIQYIDKLLYNSLADAEIGIADDPTVYTQFLWPSSEYDKLFIDGRLHLDYETVSKVAIQYPSRDVQGKTLSAVHVHPKNLCDIQKRIIEINKEDHEFNRTIIIDEANTEFYGITGETMVVEPEFISSYLLPNEETRTLDIHQDTRSFIIHARPETDYVIKSSNDATTLTKIVEMKKRPYKNEPYVNCFDVDHTEPQVAFTTTEDTHYILIITESEDAQWHKPYVNSTVVYPTTRLLIKTNASDSDYYSTIGGIKISRAVQQNFDYILAVTYVFGETTGRGTLTRTSFDITDDSQIVVGRINDPLLVFAQGHYLIQEGNYEYDKDLGLITLFFPERLDIGVITFPKFEGGYILDLNEQNEGIVTMHKDIEQPLIFVYGESMQQLADYRREGNTFYVKDAQVNMSYALVDCVDAEGNNMFVKEGTLLHDPEQKESDVCYIQVEEDFAKIPFIVFINGLLVAQKDISYDPKKRHIIIQKTTPNLPFILLKDPKKTFIHSDKKEPNTYATGASADQAMLYVDGNVIGDIEAFGVLNLPSTGYPNEIKGIVEYNSDKGYIVKKWHKYEKTGWKEIESPEKEKRLNNYLNHYILQNKTVHFTNIDTLRGKNCSAWLYKYDANIEYPLLYYAYATNNKTDFDVIPTHVFPYNQNALSVYIDGYRQYPQSINFPGGVLEKEDGGGFTIGEALPNSRIEYLIEKPENGEKLTCMLEVLTSDNVNNQTLKTNLPLLPGFIDLFIDGVRQPKTSFEVIDKRTIILNHFNKDPRYTNLILLEVRKDLSLKEATRMIKKDGQTYFECTDEMRSLLSTKDFIKIYVNGIFVGDDYELIREQGVINIPKLSDLGFAKKGHVVSFVWR